MPPALFEYQGFGFATPAPLSGAFGAPASAQALDEIVAMQANSVAITASYFMASSTASDIEADPRRTETLDDVARAVDEAHARGLSVLLKPHVDALDGKPRMQMAPADVAAWFADYKAILLDHAAVAEAKGVEMLSLGTEIDGLTGAAYRDYWVDIVDSIRAVYAGRLTYGANWDGAGKVSFWDKVDLIGIDGYMPVSFATSPSMADLIAGWTRAPVDSYYRGIFAGQAPVDYYRTLADSAGKPLLFTELGYRSVDGAAARPFDTRASVAADPQEQADLYQAFFQVFSQAGDWFKGAYMWHWSPLADAPGATDYQTEGKPAEAVIRDWFAGTGLAVPAPILDRVLEGTAGNDTLSGGIGNDRIDGLGSLGGDSLSGGSGDDVIVVRSVLDRVVELSGDGSDTVLTDLPTYTLPLYVETLVFVGTGGFTGTGNFLFNTLVGAGGNDTLDGGIAADTLVGGDGDDLLLGGTGIDSLSGGPGNDILEGGVEVDRLDGGEGFDTARFSAAAGLVSVSLLGPGLWQATLGNRNVQQLAGIEAVNAVGGMLTAGSSGADQFTGGDAGDAIALGAGDDYLAGSGGNDTMSGGDGLDWLWAGQGDDSLEGGAEKDNVNGEAGDDVIAAGSGDDRITGRDGNDTIHAGDGNDWVGVWNDWGEDPARNYFPESGDDLIFGEGGDDVLSAGLGRDTVEGGSGHDYLAGEHDDDLLSGGDGRDWLWGGRGNDTLDGGAEKDNLNGESGDDLLWAGDGNDRITGNAGNDTVHAGPGQDWVGVWNDWGEDPARNYFPEGGDDLIFGEEGDDVLSAGFGRDTVHGGAGNDYVAGEQEDDLLHGDDGIDWLWAGAGNDTLHGGEGADSLIGESGADLFVFMALADLGDSILDFNASEGDRIDIAGLLDAVGYLGTDPFGDGRLTRAESGADLLFSLDGILIAALSQTTLAQFPSDSLVL